MFIIFWRRLIYCSGMMNLMNFRTFKTPGLFHAVKWLWSKLGILRKYIERNLYIIAKTARLITLLLVNSVPRNLTIEDQNISRLRSNNIGILLAYIGRLCPSATATGDKYSLEKHESLFHPSNFYAGNLKVRQQLAKLNFPVLHFKHSVLFQD